MLCSAVFLLVVWAEIYRGQNVFELLADLIGILGLEAQSNYILTNLVPFLAEFQDFAFWVSTIVINTIFMITWGNYSVKPEQMGDISSHGATIVCLIAVSMTTVRTPYWTTFVFIFFFFLLWNFLYYFDPRLTKISRLHLRKYLKKVNIKVVGNILLSSVAVVIIPLVTLAPEYDNPSQNS